MGSVGSEKANGGAVGGTDGVTDGDGVIFGVAVVGGAVFGGGAGVSEGCVGIAVVRSDKDSASCRLRPLSTTTVVCGRSTRVVMKNPTANTKRYFHMSRLRAGMWFCVCVGSKQTRSYYL